MFHSFLQTHLPGYISKADELKQKGVKEIICISVNDPFVMEAWGKEHKVEGKVSLHRIYCRILLWPVTNFPSGCMLIVHEAIEIILHHSFSRDSVHQLSPAFKTLMQFY